jgi:hypothetical protein
MRRFTLCAVLLVAVMATCAASAVARAPEKVPFEDFPISGVLTDICPFPIEYTGSQSGHDLLFFDRNGRLTRVQTHATEELVLSANGRTLVVDPFPFNVTVRLDEGGRVTNVFLAGLVFRVRLPDGRKFVSAGRLDFIAAGVNFAVVPQVGRSGDVDALCAALAP